MEQQLMEQGSGQQGQGKSAVRWQMNRVGILNFWYYDEEEFQLEEGRLILRGANGSGKSVTMQSFLPLVLDGDKRAHRLDPFGSRDRRIEYYLLGEEDDGKTDSTAYLWMEFKHMGTGAYKTVGIGLRARRNAAQVQFWGFMLEDGRRIARDFWLYDRNRWLEDGIRLPLDRKQLESKVGTGGQVVFDQKSYQDMVNKHIFGFADTDAYQDLLQLMIQLRSPKLSKDFKPSAIYEILHQALPPLMEEELRPLSEVLEDMDQMTDRLDEIRRHRAEMTKLQERYDFYNKHILYTKSGHMLMVKSDFDEIESRVKAAESLLAQAETKKAEATVARSAIQDRLQAISVERSLLEKHEAIGKQREYEAAVKALEDIEKQLERSRAKMNKGHQRQEQLRHGLEEAEAKRKVAEREQQEFLQELEVLAGDMEFSRHALYHRFWAKGVPEDEQWKETWRRDLREHRVSVEQALAKAREEKTAASLVKESELELGEASRARDEAERIRGERDKKFDEQKEVFKDEIASWKGGLHQLNFDEEAIRETFGALRQYGLEQTSLEYVRQALFQRYEKTREILVGQRLDLEKQQKDLLNEQIKLQEEKRSWEQSREPEPERSAARAKFRQAHADRSGAPLFAVCDFRPHVADEAKARIEDALERAGLLDAWLSPDGRIQNFDNEVEDAWILPTPIEFGYTLADVLVADPPEGSGLTVSSIDAVLRSFLWDEEGSFLDEMEWNGVISSNGSYRLGPLLGKAVVKERAEFIGKETRRRTRMLEISRLSEQIAALDSELQELERRLVEQAEAQRVLTEERGAFPNGEQLVQTLRELRVADANMQAAVRQEELSNERYKSKSAKWRELQRELVELTAGWTKLKREPELAAGIGAIRDYEAALSDLHSAWRQFRDTHSAWERFSDELSSLVLELEDEEALADELDDRRRDRRAEVDTLRRLIEDLGLADVARRIEELRKEHSQLLVHNKELEQQLDVAKDQASRAEEKLLLLSEQLEAQQVRLEEALDQLGTELRRGLVTGWQGSQEAVEAVDKESLLEIMAALRTIAKEIIRQYEPLFTGRNAENIVNRLLEQFNAARMLLTEYVMETMTDETSGRLLLLSMRNPQQPLPPLRLLEELEQQEAEQSALLSEKDRELFEEIILRSVGKAIRQRIHRAEEWVRQMNKLMEERDTSSGLRLKLEWEPKPATGERELDVSILVELLKRDSHRLREDEIDDMIEHFRGQISNAKQMAQEEQEPLRLHLYQVLDYRNWFRFELKYKKGEQIGYRPLTDARFNVLSGGEKAMAMYIPLFAATWSRYSDARPDAPRLISLDEAFAGVDEENMRDMFKLLTEMEFDYMMTSQVLWGCFDTVPKLAIYEIYRPKDVDFVTLFRYRWNGKRKEYVEDGADE